jgi:hypothetical protein
MSKIVIKQKRNINSVELNSIEEYEAAPKKDIDEYEFNVSIDFYPYFFRKFYKCKDIDDLTKNLIDKIDDKKISELCSVLAIDSSNLICMNNLFDWEDGMYKELKLIEQLESSLKDGKFKSLFALSFILDELVKSYNSFRLKKKVITADIIMDESDIFPDIVESHVSKTLKCEALLEDDDVFCDVNQLSDKRRRFMFLKDMQISKKNDGDCSTFSIEFVDKSQFMFDIFFSNPYSSKGGYVDILVVIPNDDDQEYYQIFLNSSNINPFLQIRKTSLLVEKILENNSDSFEFDIEEYYITMKEMNLVKSMFNEEQQKYLDISVWGSVSKDSSIGDVFEFSKFLETFLLNLKNKSFGEKYEGNLLSIKKEEDKFTFHWKGNESDEFVNFFELQFRTDDQLNFELYESAYYFSPILLNRLVFINIMKRNIANTNGNIIVPNNIYLEHLNSLDFETLHKDSTIDELKAISKSNQDRLEQCAETKKLQLSYELQDMLIPNVNFQKNCPERTELQLLHFGLLGDFKEVIKYIIPSLQFSIVDSTLNNYYNDTKRKIALSIGSNHYSKLSSPYAIKACDNILLALSKQVNTDINHESSSYEKNYIETIQKLTNKYEQITAKNMYDDFTILTSILNINTVDDLEDNSIILPKKSPKKNVISESTVDNTLPKKSPGRPRKTAAESTSVISTSTPVISRSTPVISRSTPVISRKRKREETEQLSSNKRKPGRPKKNNV